MNTPRMKNGGRARRSARAVPRQPHVGAHGVTRPTQNVPPARSVLECGGPPPLFPELVALSTPAQSARGLAHSKTCRLFVAALTFVMMTCLAHAQSYSVDWHKIAGGGGTSTNGQFSVTGTIGQHDASGSMTNNQYSVTGGFWVLPQAVQVTSAPALSIAPAGSGQATISWTPATPGWVLQENLNLGTTNWINSVSGATNPITVPAVPPRKFYRLFKP